MFHEEFAVFLLSRRLTKKKISLFDKEFEIGAVKGALAEIGVSINKNAGVQAITNKLGELTEEQNKALSEILCKE